jgi:hypothetical protein
LYNIMEIRFSGSVSVCCEKCDTCHSTTFSGTDETLEEAIDEALGEDGWANGMCSSCLESTPQNEN